MTGLLVDALECIDCGHATPGHYSGCALRPAPDLSAFLPRRKKPALAREFKTGQPHISSIVRRTVWRSV